MCIGLFAINRIIGFIPFLPEFIFHNGKLKFYYNSFCNIYHASLDKGRRMFYFSSKNGFCIRSNVTFVTIRQNP